MVDRLPVFGRRRPKISRREIRFDEPPTGICDVLIDGTRVWSFDASRDTSTDADGVKVRWPPDLQRFLMGTAEVTVCDHSSGQEFLSSAVTFTRARRRVELFDADGRPIAVNKRGGIEPSFAQFSIEARRGVAKAIEQVLDELSAIGIHAFVTKGCLLGAARDSHLIGHDTDADVAFISRFEHPVDIIRESRRAAALLAERGMKTTRISGCAFRAWIDLPGVYRCGVDVFSWFYVGDVCYLPPSSRSELDRSSIYPLGTITLEGRQLPCPRDPAALLSLIYGPTWRTPDPSYKHTPTRAYKRRIHGWFRAGLTNDEAGQKLRTLRRQLSATHREVEAMPCTSRITDLRSRFAPLQRRWKQRLRPGPPTAPPGHRAAGGPAGTPATPGAGPNPMARRVAALEARVEELDDELAEARMLHRRLADLLDLVTDVMVPAAQGDDERTRRALAALDRGADAGPPPPPATTSPASPSSPSSSGLV